MTSSDILWHLLKKEHGWLDDLCLVNTLGHSLDVVALSMQVVSRTIYFVFIEEVAYEAFSVGDHLVSLALSASSFFVAALSHLQPEKVEGVLAPLKAPSDDVDLE